MAAGPEYEIELNENTDNKQTRESKVNRCLGATLVERAKTDGGLSTLNVVAGNAEREALLKTVLPDEKGNFALTDDQLGLLNERTIHSFRFNIQTVETVRPLVAPDVYFKTMSGLTSMKNAAYVLLLKRGNFKVDRKFLYNCETCADRLSCFLTYGVLTSDSEIVPIAFANERECLGCFAAYKKKLDAATFEVVGIKVLRPVQKSPVVNLCYESPFWSKDEERNTKLRLGKAEHLNLLSVFSTKTEVANDSFFQHPVQAVDLTGCAEISDEKARELQERVKDSLEPLKSLLQLCKELAYSEDITSLALVKKISGGLSANKAGWTEKTKSAFEWVESLLAKLEGRDNSSDLMVKAILERALPVPTIHIVKNILDQYKKTPDLSALSAIQNERHNVINYLQTNPCDVKKPEPAPAPVAASSSSSAASSTLTKEEKSEAKAKAEAANAKNVFFKNLRLVAANYAELRENGWQVFELTKNIADDPDAKNQFYRYHSNFKLMDLVRGGYRFCMKVPTDGNRHSFGPFYQLADTKETNVYCTNTLNEIVWQYVSAAMFSSSNTLATHDSSYHCVWVEAGAVLIPPNMNKIWILPANTDVMRRDIKRALLERYNSLPMFRDNFKAPPHVNTAKYMQAIDDTRRDAGTYKTSEFHFTEESKTHGVVCGRYYNAVVPDTGVKVAQKDWKFDDCWIKLPKYGTPIQVKCMGETGPEMESAAPSRS